MNSPVDENSTLSSGSGAPSAYPAAPGMPEPPAPPAPVPPPAPAPPSAPAPAPAPPSAPTPPPPPVIDVSKLPGRKSVLAACLLSLVPGLGHVYLGFTQLGILFGAIYAGVIAMLSAEIAPELEPFFGISLAFLFFYVMIDAGRRASAINLAVQGLAQPVPPPGLVRPRPVGSKLGGGLLIVIGFLLFLNTMFGMSLAWLANWWPVGMIIFGVYIFRKGMRERQENPDR